MNISLSSDTEKKLRELAGLSGQDAAEFAAALIEQQLSQYKHQSNKNGHDEDDPDALSRAVAKMIKRTPEEIAKAQARAIASCKPEHPLPPGQTIFDAVGGKWPGNESDQQIKEALERLS